jgi:hypothetical protein
MCQHRQESKRDSGQAGQVVYRFGFARPLTYEGCRQDETNPAFVGLTRSRSHGARQRGGDHSERWAVLRGQTFTRGLVGVVCPTEPKSRRVIIGVQFRTGVRRSDLKSAGSPGVDAPKQIAPPCRDLAQGILAKSTDLGVFESVCIDR